MSNTKLRNNNKCLNCGSTVEGRYCSNCGQKNVEPKETFGGLISHFFADIFHFEGSFFKTCKNLFTKPGFLSKEYITGRRASYFHPIRMYIFTSALFFLLFFYLFNTSIIGTSTVNGSQGDSLFTIQSNLSGRYNSVEQYDSLQATLPPGERDGRIYRQVRRKSIDLGKRFETDGIDLLNAVLNKFFHNFPYLLFLSLPLYALYLKLLYFRQKTFYYTDHAIFLIHLYIFNFLLLVPVMLIYKLPQSSGLQIAGYFLIILIGYAVWYAYTAMLRFYGQNRATTLLKFIILNMLVIATFIVLLVLFFFVSLLQV